MVRNLYFVLYRSVKLLEYMYQYIHRYCDNIVSALYFTIEHHIQTTFYRCVVDMVFNYKNLSNIFNIFAYGQKLLTSFPSLEHFTTVLLINQNIKMLDGP